MILNFYDLVEKKEVNLTLENEVVIPSADLYVVLILENEVCGLKNNENSSPYNEYTIKNVNHILQATTNYKGEKHILTLGFILYENEFIPFIIDQSDYFRFHTSGVYDLYFSSFRIFNYKEYSEISELGMTKMTFSEFVHKVIQNKIDRDCFQLYSIPHKDPNKLINIDEFSEFLNEEEKLKTR